MSHPPRIVEHLFDPSGAWSPAALSGAIDAVASFVEGFDPAVWSSADAADLVRCFARLGCLASAGGMLAARRVASGNGWQGDGHRSVDDWLASQTGTSTADATKVLKTAQVLEDCPATEQSLRAGELSEDQAVAVASAVAADPTAEASLLEQAATSTVEALRTRCRQVSASAQHRKLLDDRAAAHAARFCRTWTDTGDGSLHGRFRLTAEAGAIVTAALDAHHERLFAAARSEQRRERSVALHADALVAMAAAACGDGEGSGPEATIVVRVDHAALCRGYTVAGEECSLDGTGPVPVPTARRVASDAVIAALLADGDRISDVRIVGRSIPKRLRMALIARDRHCVVPGCDVARHLEIHHLDPIAQAGPTSLDNTCRICSWHHDQITYRGAHLERACDSWRYEPGCDDPGGGPFDDGGLRTRPPDP